MLIAAIGFWTIEAAPAWAEGDPAALAAALKDTAATLQGGLKASEREGTPISAKFEIEDGKLQLSVYTMKDDGFTRSRSRSQDRRDQGGRKDHGCRRPQGGDGAKSCYGEGEGALARATENAVKSNTGSRAVSIYPQLENGHPVAEVTLLQGTTMKKVTEKLD